MKRLPRAMPFVCLLVLVLCAGCRHDLRITAGDPAARIYCDWTEIGVGQGKESVYGGKHVVAAHNADSLAVELIDGSGDQNIALELKPASSLSHVYVGIASPLYLVSVDGARAQGSLLKLAPGRHTVRICFIDGGYNYSRRSINDSEVAFVSLPGHVYVVRSRTPSPFSNQVEYYVEDWMTGLRPYQAWGIAPK